jgi:Amt family ammonium transporter
MPSAYLPLLSLLGAGLMLLGWFGLASGVHMPTALDFAPGQTAAAGLLAALTGALAAAGYSWFTTRALNPLMTSRGLAAGLIVATAGAAFAPVWVFVVAGLLMGLGLPPLIYWVEQRLRLADGPGIAATYGVSAVASLLLVAVFADGRAGRGWNGVGLTAYQGITDQGVSGLVVGPGFNPDWPGQLQAQLLGAGVILVWTLAASFLLLQTIKVMSEAWARSGLEWIDPASGVDETPEQEIAATQETIGS